MADVIENQVEYALLIGVRELKKPLELVEVARFKQSFDAALIMGMFLFKRGMTDVERKDIAEKLKDIIGLTFILSGNKTMGARCKLVVLKQENENKTPYTEICT